MLQPTFILSVQLSQRKTKCLPANDYLIAQKINPNENYNEHFVFINYYTFNKEIRDKLMIFLKQIEMK